MAFHGDLPSFPLPELLQWLDSSRKTGSLQLVWDGGERRLFLAGGQIIATASEALYERIARMLELGRIAGGTQVMASFAQVRENGVWEAAFNGNELDPAAPIELAREELYSVVADLTQAQGGTFHWTEDSDRSGEEWVPVQVGLRHLLFETLRWVDEQPDVDRALPIEAMVVRALGRPPPQASLINRVILSATSEGQSLGKLRIATGLSRSGISRRVYDLLRAKLVEVEGAPEVDADPIADMLEKGAILVRERQFEAAGLVFATLLSSDPGDRRVREFARMVEREHIAALYRDLPPIQVLGRVEDAESFALLRPEERHVASLINGSWDVSTIVLASQNRELETLRCLAKLKRMGLVVERTVPDGH